MSTNHIPTYHFEGYTVRPITERDRPYLELQIQADEYHREKVTADFFLDILPGESSWALEDADGRVVFYFKNSPAVRMHIQFTADHELAGKKRTMLGLLKGLPWIEAIFKASRFREIIFDVDSPDLEEFAKRRLGFTDARNLLSRMLTPYESHATQPSAVGTVPTDRLERAG